MGLEFPPGPRPPWLNERGELLPEKLPLDSTLARAISSDKRECREAVRLLGVMQQSGRVEAGIYLMGLLAGAPDDWECRTAIIEALHGFDIEGCARLLFCYLKGFFDYGIADEVHELKCDRAERRAPKPPRNLRQVF